MRPSPSHVPFSIPYPSSMRSNVSASGSTTSEASSDSDSDGTRIAYRDEEDEQRDGNGLNKADESHTYPPTPSTAKARSKTLEPYSDLDASREKLGREGKGDDERDDEDPAELLDEEERVGLMMRERGSHGPSLSTATSHLLRERKRSCLKQGFKPFLFAGGTALAIIILLPFLRWLASSTQTGRRESVLKDEKHLTEVIVPSYWRLPDATRNGGFGKHKRPLPPGATKMKQFGPPFSLEAEVEPLPSASDAQKKKEITLDDIFSSTFAASTDGLDWSAEDPDEGVFSFMDPFTRDIIVQDVTHLQTEKTGKGEVAKGGGKVTYIRGDDVKDSNGNRIAYSSYKISPDMRFALLFSDRKQQWRHSSHSKVWLHDVSLRSTSQLGENTTEPTIATAEWSQKSYISYVEGNNLYLIKDAHNVKNKINITSDGTVDVFNAVPDWVYEEEVFSGDTAHWWSPDGNRLVFLRFEEKLVHTYSFPIYNPTDTNGKAALYPSTIDMKYPKPGTPNPIVSIFVYDVPTGTKAELHDPPTSTTKETAQSSIETSTVDSAIKSSGDSVMVTQVKWLNDQTLLVRETNRISDAMRYVAFDCAKVTSGADGSSITGTVARRETTTVSGGWISVDQDIRRARGKEAGSSAYVDIIAPSKGYKHVAYFADAYQKDPIFLTAGEWEVESILFVHENRVYFSAAYPRPSVRHILYVDLPSASTASEVKPVEKPAGLTDTSQTAWYEASFDPKGNYYQLTYQGPHVPWVKVFSRRDPSFELVVEDNSDLQNKVGQYHQPQRSFYNITTPGNVVVLAEEYRPHDFDGSGAVRYPVLINVYGGPDSQMVQAKWSMHNWRTYLTCTLGYIVTVVDGRGTGFRGREYRDLVTWRLGTYESYDVVQAGEAIRTLPYVAQSKVGLWGWSYGGYLTAKVLERDSGTFDLGMSVAPVSRWEFYDSIYTERYMKTPALNKAGYENSSVHINKGFETTQFLLAQGSADDNVHFQSSAMLLDALTGQQIRGFWFRMFPDSSHSISKRGAYRELHEFMTRFLVNKWGAGGKRIFRYAEDKGLSGLGRRLARRASSVLHGLMERRTPQDNDRDDE